MGPVAILFVHIGSTGITPREEVLKNKYLDTTPNIVLSSSP